MLLCKISLVYVLWSVIDLATGNDVPGYLPDPNSRINNGKLTAEAATTKKQLRHNSQKREVRITTETTKNTSQFHHHTTKFTYGLTDSLNLPRKWKMLQSYVTKKKRNDSIIRTTRLSEMNLVHSRRTKDTDKKKKMVEKEPAMFTPYNIIKQMNELCEELSNVNITIEKIGRTLEYNDIIILKITEKKSKTDKAYFRANNNKYLDETPEKKIVFIVHGLTTMGLEHIPCLKMSDQFTTLVSYYLAHLDKFDIFIMPMANPDGSKLDYWNKNVAPQSACIGVALDRNFDVAWNMSKSVSSCSLQYPGPFPFSEPETRAVQSVFKRYSQRIIAYFHVHAGTYETSTFKGDAVLYPKGYTDTSTDDDKYVDLRAEIDEAMNNANFRIVSVTVDSLYNWYGQVAGTSVDYASTVYGISYALELVMQPYHPQISYFALEEIWKRVINVLFISIWRSTHENDVT